MIRLMIMFVVLLCSSTFIYSQEVGIDPSLQVNDVKILQEMRGFLDRQNEALTEQRRFGGEVRDLTQRIRQLNINILSWQTATQQAAAGTNLSRVFTQFGDKPVIVTLALAGCGILGIAYTFYRFCCWLTSSKKGV